MFYASYHVPGTQDYGSSPHMTAAAAARAVQSVSRRFKTHVVLGALKKHREKDESPLSKTAATITALDLSGKTPPDG